MCEQLIKYGGETWALWECVEWYDEHWNGSLYSEPRAHGKISNSNSYM